MTLFRPCDLVVGTSIGCEGMSDKPLRVTVATLNILNDASSWPARRQLIALQEVALPANNAQWLADGLGGYTVRLCP